MRFSCFPWVNKAIVLAIYSVLLLGLLILFDLFVRKTVFGVFESALAVFVCCLSDLTALACMCHARLRNENGIAYVWLGIFLRWSGPLMAIVAVIVLKPFESTDRFLADLVFVYLVMLPVAVYLTLPEAQKNNRVLNEDKSELSS